MVRFVSQFLSHGLNNFSNQQIWICNEYRNLMIYFYDDMHAQFPSYSTENARSHSRNSLTRGKTDGY